MQLDPSPDEAAKQRMIDKLFEHWQLDDAQCNALRKLRHDQSDLLLEIHARLRLLFPYDRDLAYGWVNLRNRAFGERTPLQVLIEGRESEVISYLRDASQR